MKPAPWLRGALAALWLFLQLGPAIPAWAAKTRPAEGRVRPSHAVSARPAAGAPAHLPPSQIATGLPTSREPAGQAVPLQAAAARAVPGHGLLPEIRYLNEMGRVRAYFADAPGFGHQSSTLSLLRRMRQLGFDGEIEAVIGPDESSPEYGRWPLARKIAELLPEFDPSNPDDQSISRLGLTLRSHSSFEARGERMPLGLTGGADSPMNFPKVLRTDRFLRLSPMNWRLYPDTLYYDNGDSPAAIRIEYSWSRPLIYQPARDEDIHDAYFERLDEGRYGRDKKRGLAALARQARQSDLLPAYGLAFMNGTMLHRLILAVSQTLDARPELFRGRGVLVPLLLDHPWIGSEFERLVREGPSLLDFPGDDFASVQKANEILRRRLRMASVADPDIDKTLQGLEKGQIAVLHVGAVPPDVFEWLFRRSTLPPTLQGKNAMNLARLLGTPYLPVEDSSLEGLQEHLPREEGRARELAGQLNGIVAALRAPWGGYDIRSLSAYIADAMSPASGLRRLFHDARIRQDDYENDKLLAALRTLDNPLPSP